MGEYGLVRTRVAVFLVGLSVGACSEQRPIVSPPSAGLAFVVVSDEDFRPGSAPSRVHGPVDIQSGPVELAVTDSERLLVFIFDDTLIRSLRPAADLSDLEQVSLHFKGSDSECQRGERRTEVRNEQEVERLHFGVPRFGRAFEVVEDRFLEAHPDTNDLVRRATLSTREDRTACAPAQSLVPFGATPQLLQSGVRIGGEEFSLGSSGSGYGAATTLDQILPAGEDHILAVSENFLFLFERGQSFSNDARHVLSAFSLHPSTQEDADFTWIMRFEQESQVRYGVVSTSQNRGDDGRTRVDVFAVEQGGLRLTSTATMADEREYLLTDGRVFYLIARRGLKVPDSIQVSDRIEGPFRALGHFPFTLETPPILGPDGQILVVSETDHRVYRFAPSTGSPEPLRIQPRNIAVDFLPRALTYDRARNLLWLTSRAQEMLETSRTLRYSFETEQWSDERIRLGPEAARCGGPKRACGDIFPLDNLLRVQGSALGWMSLLNECRILLGLESPSGCEATVFSEPGEDIHTDGVRRWRAVHTEAERITVGGSGGYLLELR